MPFSRSGGAANRPQPGFATAVLTFGVLSTLFPPFAAGLTRDEAVARALSASPTLEARAFGIRRAEALAGQASRRPNPEIDVELENVGRSLRGLRESEMTLLLRQPLGPAGRRTAHLGAARAAIDRARSDERAARADVVRDVAKLFTEGLVARERLRLLEESLAVADSLVVTVEQKVRLGATLATEVARSRAARSRAAIERDEAALELERLRGALASSWGGTADDVEELEGELDAAPQPAPADSILAKHPLVVAWRDESRVRTAEARVARSEGRWAPAVSAGYRLLDGADGGTFLVGVSTPLPFFDRKRDASAASELGAREAERDGEAVRRALKREADSLVRQRESRRTSLEAIRTTLLPAVSEAYAGVESAYRLGRLTYLDLLDARRSVVEARLLVLEALGDINRIDADIEWTLAGDAGGTTLNGEVR
jgi:cobalt-zinc-cadmium efflux system outer membrane protein